MPRRLAVLVAVLSLVLALLASAPGAVAETTSPVRLFAGVASAVGGNNTQWRSEVVLTNIGDAAVDVTLEVVPRGEAGVVASQFLSLAPGETRRIPDVYAAMSVPSGAGTLRVTGDVLAWVRTFNQGASGTFGQDVPPATPETAFPLGAQVLFPINTPADSKTEFRSNLLLLNLESTPVTFTLMSGFTVKTYEVPAGVFAQLDRIGSWMGLPSGPAMLTVTANGSWSGMVSTIDPVLGDPTTMRGLVATTRSVTQFSGVASAIGVNETQWRSEATIYNPRMSLQSVTLELIPRGESAVASRTTVNLAPLQQTKIADVYTALGAASGAGTLRVTGDVLTWVRTFNQGAGATFGQDVPEVVPGAGFGPQASVSFPVSTAADVKSDFRSNFLVFNHESRTTTLTLKSGTVSGTLDVPAGTFLQKDKVGLWLGLPAGVSTMSVTGNGRWTGMVATIDPVLGDPTTMIGVRTTGNPTPTAQGTPTGDATTATIGPAGGTLSSGDGRLSLVVPAGALVTPVMMTMQPITNLAWGGIGLAYRFGPAGTVFSMPATLTFHATTADTSSVSAEGLGMGYQDADGYWHWLANAVTDPVARTVSINLSQIGGAAARSAAGTSDGGRLGSADALGLPAPQKDYSMLTGIVLLPSNASVKESETLSLAIKECLSPLAPLTGESPDPWVFPCDTYPFYKAPTSFWAVNGVSGGNATFGTIDGFMTHGTFTAPAKAPNPATVTVTAQVSHYLNYQNITLWSQVTIGSQLKGTFTLKETRADSAKATVRGDAELQEFLSDSNGVSYNMKGTVTIDSSFTWYGLTCTCTESTTKPIPADSVFSIQRKPSLAQHWVMPGVSWNFVCNPGGITMPFAVGFLMAQGGGCGQSVWLPLSDEKHPVGSFLYTCALGFSVDASWDFSSE
jgi:hypothetical protein